jgi:hypothetical protein
MGLDAEGELNQVYRPTGHPGLWIAVGQFGAARSYSKHLVSLCSSIFSHIICPMRSYRVSRSWRKRLV